MKSKPARKKATKKTSKPLPRENTGIQKASRKTVQAKQQEISHLQFLASLEQYAPRWRISGVRPDGVLTTERVKSPWGEREPTTAMERGDWEEWQRKQFLATSYPALLLVTARAELQDVYNVAVVESLTGIEAGNLLPFIRHLSLIGPTLLAEPRIVPHIHDWWLSAKNGSLVDAHRLNAVLAALKPGKGKMGNLDPERERQERKSRQQQRRDTIRAHEDALDTLLKDNPSAVKTRLAKWTQGNDTLKKTAATEWKKKKQHELR